MTTTKLPTDLPEGYLQIGGFRFYQFFQDMDMITPSNWDLKEDPIYYTTINGILCLYNDITREMYVGGHETLAIVEDDDNVISFLGIKYDSISELIKALDINNDIQAETIAETLQDLSYWLDMIVTEDNNSPETHSEPTHALITLDTTVTESQDNQDELVKTYEVSTVEGLETDEPEYNVYIVTATNPSIAAGIIKARLMSQKTRFNILGVSEAPTMIEDDDEWLEF
jgi:hypothetical protein